MYFLVGLFECQNDSESFGEPVYALSTVEVSDLLSRVEDERKTVVGKDIRRNFREDVLCREKTKCAALKLISMHTVAGQGAN